jgi:regulator of replication initiation timing
LVKTNKSLKQSNKDISQKLEEALKQNELLTQENERLKKLLQEYQNGSNNLNKKIPVKKYQNKEESSENEEE